MKAAVWTKSSPCCWSEKGRKIGVWMDVGPLAHSFLQYHDASHVAPLLMLLASHQFHILLSTLVYKLLSPDTNSSVPVIGVHRKCCVPGAQQKPDSNMREGSWAWSCLFCRKRHLCFLPNCMCEG